MYVADAIISQRSNVALYQQEQGGKVQGILKKGKSGLRNIIDKNSAVNSSQVSAIHFRWIKLKSYNNDLSSKLLLAMMLLSSITPAGSNQIVTGSDLPARDVANPSDLPERAVASPCDLDMKSPARKFSQKQPVKKQVSDPIGDVLTIPLIPVMAAALLSQGLRPQFRFIDRAGHTVFDEHGQVSFEDFFSNGLLSCRLSNGKSCYWNKKGKLAFPKYYFAADDFSEGLAKVKDKEDGGWGYIDTKGNLQIQYQFDRAFPFSEGMAAVKMGNHWGFIDRTGKLVVKATFNGAASFSQGLAPVKIGEKIGYIDKKGDVVIKPQYDFAESFFDDRAYTVSLANQDTPLEKQYDLHNKSYEYIDKSGNVVIDSSAAGLKAVTGWYFLNTTSTFCLSANEEYKEQHNQFGIPSEAFEEGIACVSNGQKYGFIDKQGAISIPLKFNLLEPFSEGRAIFSNTSNTIPAGGKMFGGNNLGGRTLEEKVYGYIDRNGTIAIQPAYLRASSFSEGLACVADSRGYVFIDKTGKKVFKLNEKDYRFRANRFQEGLTKVGRPYENF